MIIELCVATRENLTPGPLLISQKCLTQTAQTAILTCREKLHDPVAQWIERQIADLQAGGSSPLGIANAESTCKSIQHFSFPLMATQQVSTEACFCGTLFLP